LLCLALLAPSTPLFAQTTVQSSSPTLAELLRRVYGPDGLTVNSEAVLPDGSTHSAHFNGAFQSEFTQINIALVRQLGALPIPSPASGFTYAFDTSTGTFVRSTQSFGPILADRAETIGRGRFAFGYSLQEFSFHTFDGMRLSHIPAVFTHDNFQQGGGLADVITTQNAIAASVTQSAFSLTYGPTDRLDLSLAVPVIRTTLGVTSDATIHRLGTASNPAIHFFRDPAAPGTYGSERRYESKGTASGLGDLIVRGKGTALKTPRAGIAIGLEARLPTGNEENLLGSGAVGVKLFEAVSFAFGRITPHINAGYQWNGRSVLAGDLADDRTADFPDELSYIVGADIAVERRLSMDVELLGRHAADAPRLTRRTFVSPSDPSAQFADIAFTSRSLDALSGAFGLKANVAGTALVTFNLLFKLDEAGVRTKATPLIGVEYSF
jgi:hypothetical protein